MRRRSVGICSDCGGELICERSEEGGWDEYIGCYTHSCAACGYIEYRSEWIREGVVGSYDEPHVCPECERLRMLREQ